MIDLEQTAKQAVIEDMDKHLDPDDYLFPEILRIKDANPFIGSYMHMTALQAEEIFWRGKKVISKPMKFYQDLGRQQAKQVYSAIVSFYNMLEKSFSQNNLDIPYINMGAVAGIEIKDDDDKVDYYLDVLNQLKPTNPELVQTVYEIVDNTKRDARDMLNVFKDKVPKEYDDDTCIRLWNALQ